MTLKMPVKVKKFELNGDYAGFEFSARTNFPIGIAEKMAGGDVGVLIESFTGIITAWNFVDENGDSLGEPKDRDNMSKIPVDMINKMAEMITEAITTVPNQSGNK